MQQQYGFNLVTPKEKYCQECNKLFITTRNKQKYCSDECRRLVQKRYVRKNMKEWMTEQRLMNNISKFSPEQINKLEEIVKKQQFIEDIPIKIMKKCSICNSDKNLIEHHISYEPVEKVILCRKCHCILHISILKYKKCRPIRYK